MSQAFDFIMNMYKTSSLQLHYDLVLADKLNILNYEQKYKSQMWADSKEKDAS